MLRGGVERLDWAIGQERVIVTRDYSDFSHLAEVAQRHGRSFPGVLFVSRVVRPGDVGAITAGIERFVRGVGGGRGGLEIRRPPVPKRSTWGWPVRMEYPPLVTAGATAVCIAAVLTRQHYVLDIPAGIALAVAGWAVVRRVGGVAWREASRAGR